MPDLLNANICQGRNNITISNYNNDKMLQFYTYINTSMMV